MAGGFIVLWRKLTDHPIWMNSTAEQRAVLVELLFLASWKESRWEICGEVHDLKPGQFFMSTRDLAERTKVSHQTLRTTMKRFEKMGFLTQESTHRGTLITIVNWAKYQGVQDKLTQEATRDQHTPNTQVTHDQHMPNTTIKEPSNQVTKKPGNQVTSDRAAPTRKAGKARPSGPAEVEEFFNEQAYDFDHHLEASKFWDYWESVGWLRKGNRPIKDWKGCARSWAGNVAKYEDKPQTFRQTGGLTTAECAQVFRQDNERGMNHGGNGTDGASGGDLSDVFGF